ncbi:PQQ-dependent sugar dehydrogenase [Adhaeribacter swui]|uniref:PQQ-dependent sugar dehydrogenase n=1 Tax=Adhaeribacter swui TaxID=2086471 RepID=A0A7G7GA25_9BACT|nr:PQQ-dependent sugar dehydrogenase [Adhaeribacter swui]QNF34009.1 PQQ-dependent sugar dehydrogenase [Adhaeribacter swui]
MVITLLQALVYGKKRGFFSGLLFYLLLSCFSSQAQTLPAGFSRVQVASGIAKPTALAFAPDGRLFVAQQDGTLRVIKNNKLLTTPFLKLKVDSNGERGLIGLVFDPNFASNKYLYVYYTLANSTRNRISRFTANGDVVVAGSEVVVLDLDPLSSASNHNGGAMHFGKDGKLYVAIGENANPAQSQDLNTYHGKLLRINPNGSVPAGNPYTTGSEQRKRIWASGLRNPYTFAVQPGTGRIFVNDVGQYAWEEINDATTGGKNFGWPAAEGVSTDPQYDNPFYTYKHAYGTVDGTGCAITGGVFFNPTTTNYPAAYQGRYFYQDLCSKWINVLDLSGATPKRESFATNLGYYALGLTVGTDGNLYYLERSANAIFKIIYTTNSAPKIVQQPVSLTVTAGQSATFSVAVSGKTPFTYQWQKNNANISGATQATYTIASTKAADAGNYRVVVKNSAGSATSNSVALIVTGFNNPPVAQIITPAEKSFYRAGDAISFSGEGTDVEDGTLPASAFSWSVDFHHDTHHHDGPPVAAGVKSGSFTIPTSGEVSPNVWYRLLLTVKDSKGLTHTTYRDIYPYLATISLVTQPAGLKVTLDGQPINAPFSVNSVVGLERSIGPVANQTLNGKTYVFEKWLHGGTATQTISTPKENTTYTAVYRESNTTTMRLEAENAYLQGVIVATGHGGYSGTGYADYNKLSGEYIEWTIQAPTAGIYNLSFRYALLSGTRTLRLAANGTLISSAFPFTATGQWTNWASKSVSIDLKAGINKVRLTSTGTMGPDLDYLEVTPSSNVSVVDLRIYPNPAKSYLQVELPATPSANCTLTLYNNQGTPVFSTTRDNQNPKNQSFRIPVANFPKGLYILKMQQGKQEISERIILE